MENSKISYKVDCFVASKTQVMKLGIWEKKQWASLNWKELSVQESHSSHIWQCYVSTNKATTITEIDDIQNKHWKCRIRS